MANMSMQNRLATCSCSSETKRKFSPGRLSIFSSYVIFSATLVTLNKLSLSQYFFYHHITVTYKLSSYFLRSWIQKFWSKGSFLNPSFSRRMT